MSEVDILPLLRAEAGSDKYDRVARNRMGYAADEIEGLRKRVTELEKALDASVTVREHECS